MTKSNEWKNVQTRMRDRCAAIACKEHLYGKAGLVIASEIQRLDPEPPPEPLDKVFPPHTRHRRTDPDTSREAAHRIKAMRVSQLTILAILRSQGPSTDSEIWKSLCKLGAKTSPSGARTRRSELVQMGEVEDSGRRKTTETGRRTIVWRAV